jgi:hypothetical protein
MHMPRRLGSHPAPAPLVQLALDPDSPRGQRLGPNHHLWRNGRLWWIAYTLLHDGWRQERIRHSLGTDDLLEARVRRDRILDHFCQAGRASTAHGPRQYATCVDPEEGGARPLGIACDR